MPWPLQILLVEDDQTDAALVVETLRNTNFDPYVHRVDTEPEYTAALRPDLDIIISDHSMTKFSGIRALKLAKNQGYEIPFILFSGVLGEERTREAVENGAWACLTKDKPKELGLAVLRALEKRQLDKQSSSETKASLEIQEGERKFRTLFDAAHDSIYMLHNGVFVDCNAQGLYMFGRTWDQIVGHTPDEFAPEKQPDGRNSREKAYEIVSRALAGEAQTFEWTSLHANGTPATSEVSLNRLEMGGTVYLMAVARDVTEKRMIEAQLIRAQRLQSIGTLAGGIAHDLNNILTPILASIETLKLTQSDAKARQTLKTVENSAKRGADIVRQVLSFARGIKGQRAQIQPKRLLQDIATLIGQTFPKSIDLKLAVPKDCWPIHGDATQLHQILLNLSLNARDAMPEGGTLTISAGNVELTEQEAEKYLDAKPRKYVMLTVRDTGTGIPAAIVDKIFEPFFTTKEVGKGTGLGLSTVVALTKSHDGFIDVQSAPGRGTAFMVYLPMAEANAPRLTDSAALASLPRGRGETILVVDDEPSILSITGDALESFGYRVLTAHDGAEAVAIFERNAKEIAAVITDMTMPVMDGPATIRALLRIDPKVRIIASSGFMANAMSADGAVIPSKHFLAKPYTTETLLKTVRATLKDSAAAPS